MEKLPEPLLSLPTHILLGVVRRFKPVAYVRFRRTCCYSDFFCEVNRKKLRIQLTSHTGVLLLSDVNTDRAFYLPQPVDTLETEGTEFCINYGRQSFDFNFRMRMTEENIPKILKAISGFGFCSAEACYNGEENNPEARKDFSGSLPHFYKIIEQLAPIPQLETFYLTAEELNHLVVRLKPIDLCIRATDLGYLSNEYVQKVPKIALYLYQEHEKIDQVNLDIHSFCKNRTEIDLNLFDFKVPLLVPRLRRVFQDWLEEKMRFSNLRVKFKDPLGVKYLLNGIDHVKLFDFKKINLGPEVLVDLNQFHLIYLAKSGEKMISDVRMYLLSAGYKYGLLIEKRFPVNRDWYTTIKFTDISKGNECSCESSFFCASQLAEEFPYLFYHCAPIDLSELTSNLNQCSTFDDVQRFISEIKLQISPVLPVHLGDYPKKVSARVLLFIRTGNINFRGLTLQEFAYLVYLADAMGIHGIIEQGQKLYDQFKPERRNYPYVMKLINIASVVPSIKLDTLIGSLSYSEPMLDLTCLKCLWPSSLVNLLSRFFHSTNMTIDEQKKLFLAILDWVNHIKPNEHTLWVVLNALPNFDQVRRSFPFPVWSAKAQIDSDIEKIYLIHILNSKYETIWNGWLEGKAREDKMVKPVLNTQYSELTVRTNSLPYSLHKSSYFFYLLQIGRFQSRQDILLLDYVLCLTRIHLQEAIRIIPSMVRSLDCFMTNNPAVVTYEENTRSRKWDPLKNALKTHLTKLKSTFRRN